MAELDRDDLTAIEAYLRDEDIPIAELGRRAGLEKPYLLSRIVQRLIESGRARIKVETLDAIKRLID